MIPNSARAFILAALMSLARLNAVWAQADYPARSVRVMVPSAPRGIEEDSPFRPFGVEPGGEAEPPFEIVHVSFNLAVCMKKGPHTWRPLTLSPFRRWAPVATSAPALGAFDGMPPPQLRRFEKVFHKYLTGKVADRLVMKSLSFTCGSFVPTADAPSSWMICRSSRRADSNRLI
jgi:hypothetical protein